VGAYLMADISHTAGLIIAGAHPSPIDHAHFTTTSTYKPGGPRGGLILMGKDCDTTTAAAGRKMSLCELIQKTTFPGVQGTPYLNNVAAKAVFFREALSEEYKARQFRIIENAKALADRMLALGHDVLTEGTDTHMVLINVASLRKDMTGIIAQKCLEDCGIIVNKNKLPYDTKSMAVASGVRLGTPIVTKSGMGAAEMHSISELIDAVLKGVSVVANREYRIDESLSSEIRNKVRELCRRFPMR
ncbi:MAG: serine hydroxymethyltransferase, partial [Planctomycetota bacterium]